MGFQYDEYASKANVLTECHPKSLLHENAKARIKEQDDEGCCRNGSPIPMNWDERTYRIRHRYREGWVHMGHSTHCKSPDNIY